MKNVITLCGSTSFKRAFAEWNTRLTLQGYVVLSVSVFTHADCIQLSDKQVESLNKIHKRKIDLCDEVFILDVDGYMGEGTRDEIAYAESKGKVVRYLSQERPGWNEFSFSYTRE